MLNLGINAINFTDHGDIQVSIKCVEESKFASNETKFLFSVTDPGIGIEQSKLNLIFDEFQQADGSTSSHFGGTGLGLAISKRLVTLMGGDIWVTSNMSQGSTFSFNCRMKLAGTPIGFSEELLPHRSRRILLIEDRNAGGFPVAPMLLELGLQQVVVTDEQLSPDQWQVEWSCAIDVALVSTIETALKLRALTSFPATPLVLMAPKISLTIKSAGELGVKSCIMTPCRPVDIWNGILPALEHHSKRSPSRYARSLAILLAEDNEVNQKVAVGMLEKNNQKVTVVPNGLQAVQMAKYHSYDIILMDVQMPVMGGFEATGKIRQHEQVNSLPRTPIVALTAHAMLGDRDKCIAAGMDDYLPKPLDSNRMMQTIEKCAVINISSLSTVSS